MATQSSQETRDRAQHLAEAIGSYHIDMNIDDAYKAERDLLTQATGFTPKFKVYGGSNAENLALVSFQWSRYRRHHC